MVSLYAKALRESPMRRAASACAPRFAFERPQDEFFLCALEKAGEVERVGDRDCDYVGGGAISPGRRDFLLRQGQIVCADFKLARGECRPARSDS